jgi:hypothetical protein
MQGDSSTLLKEMVCEGLPTMQSCTRCLVVYTSTTSRRQEGVVISSVHICTYIRRVCRIPKFGGADDTSTIGQYLG